MNSRRLLTITVCALGGAWALSFITHRDRISSPITARITAPAPEISAAARSLRPNYPYSIIAGGAYSPAELRWADEKDPLVRQHYSDFNIRNSRLVVLTADRYQYVSFKLNQRIFWTRKRLRIPKGEILLTDGYNYARTRCGNRLSNTPKAETTAMQPAEHLLSLPAYGPQLIRELPLAETPPMGELAQLFPNLPITPAVAPVLPTGAEAALPLPETWPPVPTFTPIIPMAPGYLPSQAPTPNVPNVPSTPALPVAPVIAPVPEPGTVYLLLLSLCLSLGALGFMARRSGKS